MKKTTKTQNKYDFIVDLTKCEGPEWVKFEFIRAKATSGVKITDKDIDFIFTLAVYTTLNAVEYCLFNTELPDVIKITDRKKIKSLIKVLTKKEPWYKRFWSWIKKPFKKNK